MPAWAIMKRKCTKLPHGLLVGALKKVAWLSAAFTACCLTLAHHGIAPGSLPDDASDSLSRSLLPAPPNQESGSGHQQAQVDHSAVEAASASPEKDEITDLPLDVQSSGIKDHSRFLREVRHWAEAAPSAAASWAEGLNDEQKRRDALEQVAVAWAAKDPAASVAWFKTLPDDTAKLPVGLALGYEVAREEPIVAVDLLARLPEHAERDHALAHSVSQWALLDLEAASEWAMNLEAGPLRSKVLAGISVAAAESDGNMAAEFAASWLEAGDEQNRAAIAIIQRWGQASPEEASAWASQFPNGLREIASQALESLASPISHTERNEAGS